MAALRPPFQGVDLQGLFKKVQAGVFDRIPSIYSSDLSSLISQMLKISPGQRPSSDQILSNPIVGRHYNQGGLLPAYSERA
jgi:NIMA (never in mitosis gene a)-related kinase